MVLTRKQYLAAMGVDVWVSRPPKEEGITGPVPATRPEPPIPASAALKVQARAPLPERSAPSQAAEGRAARQVPEEVPRFSFALLRYGSVGLCLSLANEEKLPRRFCDDVARAAGGDVESAEFQQLNWPMVKSASLDQCLDAAREVVTHKFSQLPDRIFVFGHDVCAYHHPIARGKPGEVVRDGAKQYVLMAGASEVMASPAEKRRLWKLINATP